MEYKSKWLQETHGVWNEILKETIKSVFERRQHEFY